MLSKYARLSIHSVRHLSLYQARSQTNRNSYFKSNCFLTHPTIPTVRLMSNSLAEELLKSKQQGSAQKEPENTQSNNEEDDKNKGRKPFTKWQKIGYCFFAFSMVSLAGNAFFYFAFPERDEHGNDIEDEFSSLPTLKQYYGRFWAKAWQAKKEIEEPWSDKLLPDELKEPYIQPKYTILLELTGVLLHSSWTHKHGWRFQKRPGLDILLSQIGYPNFELVIYTVEQPMTFFNVIDGIDPHNQYINYRLFRDATRSVGTNKHPTKDVASLNRDPKKVILIDWNKDSVALAMENTLLLKKWEGDTSDTSLIGLAQLLHSIKNLDVDDVREVLSHYRNFEDPIAEFRENQRKYQEEMAVNEEKMKKEIKHKPLLSGLSFMRRK